MTPARGVTASGSPVGGTPALPAGWWEPTPDEGRVAWLASGRDAYLLAVQASGVRRWLMPEPLCAVVPETLRAAGCTVVPYRHGRLGDVARGDAATVLAWDVAAGPHPADVEAARDALLVVEDRALWAGLPADLPADAAHAPSAPVWALGSARKWLGTAEGGWLVGPQAWTATSPRRAAPAAQHAALQLAAAAVRAARVVPDGSIPDAALDPLNAALTPLAEDAVGIPTVPRAMSSLGRALLGHGVVAVRVQRAATAAALARRLGATWLPGPGASGLRLAVDPARRDALRTALRTAGILAPVHWPDAAWSGDAMVARALAGTLTLPAGVDEAARPAFVERVAGVLAGSGAQVVERVERMEPA